MKTKLKLLLSAVLFVLSFPSSYADCCTDPILYIPAGMEDRQQIFTDISMDDKDYWFTAWLNERDIFQGYPDGSFGKLNEIKRAELMAVVVRGVAGIKPSLEEYNHCFSDVGVPLLDKAGNVLRENPKDEWFVPYVCYAAEQGWVNGYGDGSFGPGDLVTTDQSFKIILNPLFQEQIEAQEGFLEDQETVEWGRPYANFAETRNLLPAKEFMGEEDNRHYWYDNLSDNIPRVKVAELMFKALMSHEQNWGEYQDYLADRFLADEGKDYLFSPDAPCYDFRETPLPDFMINYVQQEYGIDAIIEDWRVWKEGEQTLPFFDANGFCFLENGNSLLFGGSVNEQEALLNHRVEFDPANTVIEDETLTCGNSEEGFLTHPFTLVMHILDPNSLEILDCRYAKDKNHVYLHGWYGLDGNPVPATFQQLEYPYSTDGIQVFYFDTPIEGANPDDFTILFPENSHNWYKPAYAISDGIVYYESFKIKEKIYNDNFEPEPVAPVDLESFEVIDVPDLLFSYLSDSEVCHWHDTVYAKDKNTVYAGYYPLDYLDPATFEIVDCKFAKDKNGIYIASDQPIIEAIPMEGNGIWDVYFKRYVGPIESIEIGPEDFERIELPEIESHFYTGIERLYYKSEGELKNFDLDMYTAKFVEEDVIEDANGNRCEVEFNESDSFYFCQFEGIETSFTNEKYNYTLSLFTSDSIVSNQYATEPKEAFNVSLDDENGDFLMNITVLDPELYPSDQDIINAYNLPLKDYVEHIKELNKDNLYYLNISQASAGGVSGYSISVRDGFKDDSGGYLFLDDYPIHNFIFIEHNGLKYQFELPKSSLHRGEMILNSLTFQ